MTRTEQRPLKPEAPDYVVTWGIPNHPLVPGGLRGESVMLESVEGGEWTVTCGCTSESLRELTRERLKELAKAHLETNDDEEPQCCAQCRKEWEGQQKRREASISAMMGFFEAIVVEACKIAGIPQPKGLIKKRAKTKKKIVKKKARRRAR